MINGITDSSALVPQLNVDRRAFLNTRLILALRVGDLPQCRELLRGGVVVPAAARPRFEELERGANVAFREAFDEGKISLCHLWIAGGADPNASLDGSTLLMRAIDEQNLPKCKLLIRLGAIPNEAESRQLEEFQREADSGLQEAIHQNDMPLCRRWIAKGADPNARIDGTKLLTAAIRDKNLPKCHFLLDIGASLPLSELPEIDELWRANEGILPTYRELKSREATLTMSEVYLLAHLKSKLNVQLAEALEREDYALGHASVEQGADLIKSYLHRAMRENDLLKCKYLIDMGITLSPPERAELEELWAKVLITSDFAKQVFLTRRPALYKPQIFLNGNFRYLEGCTANDLQNQTKPIFFLNVADEKFNAYYAAVSQFFTNRFDRLYQEIAGKFTLVRVLVDCSDQLVDLVEKVQGLLPHLSFGHWAIEGHGDPKCVVLSPRSELREPDGPRLELLGEKLGPLVHLSFWSCCNERLIAEWSRWLGGRIVFGSDFLVNEMIPKIFHSSVLKRDLFVPCFKQGHLREVKAYVRGRLVATDQADGELPPAFIREIEAHGGVLCNEPIRMIDSYF